MTSTFKGHRRDSRDGKFNYKRFTTWNNARILYEYCRRKFPRIRIVKAGYDMEVARNYFFSTVSIVYDDGVGTKFFPCRIRR